MRGDRLVAGEVLVLVGTVRGTWRFWSDSGRRDWRQATSQSGVAVHAAGYDARDGRLYAAVNGNGHGSGIDVSDDLGQTWRRTGPFPANITEIWQVQPGHPNRPAEMWAGARDAALYHSTDRGDTWAPVLGLNEHPTRATWMPGGGGLILHTIVPDPTDAACVYACVSAGGAYRSDDGGAHWRPINRGVRADFLDDGNGGDCQPETGHCVHKLVLHPARPARLYQQNHCGVYRSDDRGETWLDISEGLPSRFGFPIAVHPHDPATVFVVPLVGDFPPFGPPDGQLAVWRSRDAGATWTRHMTGLPQGEKLTVLRDAMATDTEDPAGLYMGTADGRLLHSRDDGESWTTLAEGLPRILSVTAARVGG